MSGRKFNKKRFVFLVGGSIIFLLLSLWVGLVLVGQPQNIIKKAAGNCTNPGSIVECPRSDGVLVSCNPPDANGNAQLSLCSWSGRVEKCNNVNYCCPAAGGSWTTNMAGCTVIVPPTPVPTPQAPTASAPLTNINCPASNPLPVTFSWSVIVGATSYTLNIDDMSNGWNGCTTPNANDYCITVTSGTSHNLNLPINKTYRWGVAANNSANVQGPASAIINFTIGGSCTTPTTPPTAPPTAVPSPIPTKSPSPLPTRTPTPTPNITSCTSFTDNFSNTTLDSSKWATWSSSLGSSRALTNGQVTFYNTQSTSSTDNGQSIYAVTPAIGDFSTELTLKEHSALNNKLESSFGLSMASTAWAQYIQVYKPFSKIPGELSIQWFDGVASQKYGISDGIDHNTPVKVRIERIGSNLSIYYDKLNGSGYKLIKKINNYYTGPMGADIGLSNWGPDFPQTSAVVDDYKLTCGVPITPAFPPWDIDLNGKVNIIDIGILIDNYAKLPISNLRTDVNSDGSVDIVDIGIIIDHYVLQ